MKTRTWRKTARNALRQRGTTDASAATAPEAVEAILAYVREVFAARGWQVTDQPCQTRFWGVAATS